MSSSVLLSGNNFSKVARLCKSANLKFVSESTFYRVQRRYCAPAIEKYWQTERQAQIAAHQNKDLAVAGDGRNDSPGHSARYCTNTLIDTGSNAVLEQEVVDVRQADGKSPSMEKIGCRSALLHVKQALRVIELVTDGSPQIMKMMKSEPDFTNITHSLDVWPMMVRKV